MRELSDQELRYCEHYAIHRKSGAAYRHAYACNGWSTEMISSESWKIRQRPQIALKLYELAEAGNDAFKVSVAEKKQWLKTIIELNTQVVTDAKTNLQITFGDAKAAISAVAELNKMDGDLAAQKKEITGIIGINIDSDDDEL